MTALAFRNPDDVRQVLADVRDHLESGRLLAYPTETVYGFGCRAREPDVQRLAQMKGRPARKPFLLLASRRAMVRHLGLDLIGFADRLGEVFWPGPITLVLPGGEGTLPDALRGPEGGIAVRVTSQPATAMLIENLGYPITSTSANHPGCRPAAGAAGIVEEFGDAVAGGELLVLDGGVLGNVPSSTVVDCTGDAPRIIRDGAVSQDAVMAVARGDRP